MGSLMTSSTILEPLRFLDAGSSLYPSFCSRSAASLSESPFTESISKICNGHTPVLSFRCVYRPFNISEKKFILVDMQGRPALICYLSYPAVIVPGFYWKFKGFYEIDSKNGAFFNQIFLNAGMDFMTCSDREFINLRQHVTYHSFQ
jgi:hypothetical protein